ncbi:MAG: pilus assembly protein PilP [Desulfuromonadaceae bacterium]|nr:pilus assembly protein PilP [Desulfuromonadaceae bacterium]
MIKKLLKRNSFFSTSAGVLFCALVLSACGKDQPVVATPAPAKPPKAATVVVSKPVQNVASSASRLLPVPANQFDFSNKKDPFRPFIVINDSKRSLDSMKKTQYDSFPIHRFDVNQFKLIGIVSGIRENRAMVTDPGGKGYVLKVGMSIGKNNGKVVLINSNGVNVVEQYKDESGKTRQETIKLTLPRKQ